MTRKRVLPISRFDSGEARADSLGHMVSRRFSVWQKVVALAPLLLLAVYLPGQMMLRCRIDGTLRPACCCPDEAATRDVGPVLKAQDCCERELSASDRPVVEPAKPASVDVTWAVSAPLPPVPLSTVLSGSAQSERAWQAQGPPGEGPPLVLLKHAFLI
jgi:hypothetical protein